MSKHPKPTAERVRELLSYDPETGGLTWKPRPREMFSSERIYRSWNAKLAGKPALYTNGGDGYLVGRVDDHLIGAHRVIWAIVHGEWPENDIDHKNGNRCDNRLANLRAATRQQNLCNSALRSDNTSGFKGVYWRQNCLKWAAEIQSKGVRYNLGFFATREEAHAAYRKASLKLHGEFARAA